ncbi:esterase family protein [Metallosphaera tengchongensis]|uniref:Esterase family protein n=2 Tax=Metallosphaera tengchongensis TaxID=1532350 RepID=A0A6N0NZF0_9CREN|nr:esterase family protein [Metallosphaera tengchongensis]
MKLDFLDVESQYLKDNPLGDSYKRKVAVIRPEEAEGIPAILYLSGYFSSPVMQLNPDPLSENLKERLERLVREGKVPKITLILPDTFTKLGGNQYIDSPAAGQYESFLMKEVIPLVKENYSIDRFAVMGKSSGGFGALHLGSKYEFSAIASHSADAYFEYAYLPLFPRAIPTLRRTGDPRDYVSYFWSQADRKRRDLMDALMIVGLSAFYSKSSTIELPFDLETGEILEDVWKTWLEFDPVRFLPRRMEKVKGKRVYIDVGDRDDFFLQYGNKIIHKILRNWKVDHIFEEFRGGHMNTSYRYELSLSFLSKSLYETN